MWYLVSGKGFWCFQILLEGFFIEKIHGMEMIVWIRILDKYWKYQKNWGKKEEEEEVVVVVVEFESFLQIWKGNILIFCVCKRDVITLEKEN